MRSREYFQHCRFLVDSYENASRHLQRSMRSDDWFFERRNAKMHLARAARELCDALSIAAEHEKFNLGVAAYLAEHAHHVSEISEVFADLEKFLDLEFEILQRGGMSPRAAAQLALDIARSIRIVSAHADRDAIENFQTRLAECAKAICGMERTLREPTEGPTLRKRMVSAMPSISAGMQALGGAALIVVNALSAVQAPVFYTSAFTGLVNIGRGAVDLSPTVPHVERV